MGRNARHSVLQRVTSAEMARETLRAAMRTIAEEAWLAWNHQLDLLDPGWRERSQMAGASDQKISSRVAQATER